MSEHRDENAIGIVRVNQNVRNLLAVAQPQVRPGVSAVGGSVNSIAGGKIGAPQAFAAADINYVRVRRSDRQRADRAGRLFIENRNPGAAGVGALPHAAVIHADVKKIGLAGNARGGDGASSAEWPDAAPLQILIHARIELRLAGAPVARFGGAILRGAAALQHR